MRIDNEVKLDFDDVLIRPKRSTLISRKDVDLNRRFVFKWSEKEWTGIPIIATNMDTVGTVRAALVMQEHKMFTWLHKFVGNDQDCTWNEHTSKLEEEWFAPTIGESTGSPPTLNEFEFVRIDVANGYRQSFVDFVKKVRFHYPLLTIFAGNVCTPEMTEELILAGVDVVVIGIGPGAQCTTRIKAGVGYPQLHSVIECADAAHGLGGHIVADGGCRTPADVAKAFAAGADFVALGTMLAGHEENTREENRIYETVYPEGHYDHPAISVEPTHARVYGMSSKEAMDKYYGGVADHRTAEGACTTIPFKGPLKNTIQDILGGLRSTCTYVGASRLKELSKRTTFVRIR